MSIPKDPLKGLGITPIPQAKAKKQEPLTFGPPPPTKPKVQEKLLQNLKNRTIAQIQGPGIGGQVFNSVVAGG